MLTNCKVDDIVTSSLGSKRAFYPLILHTFMSKLNSLSSVALASALALAPATAEAAQRKDTVADENADTIGGFQAKIGAMAGFAIGHLELAFGGHLHTTEPDENGAFETYLAWQGTENFKLGVKFQDDTHKENPDTPSLGGFANITFGRSDQYGLDFGMQFDLRNGNLAGLDARLTGEFDNGVFIGGGFEREKHTEMTNSCVLAEVGYRGWDIKDVHSLATGVKAGPCVVSIPGTVTSGGVNASELIIYTNLVPHF